MITVCANCGYIISDDDQECGWFSGGLGKSCVEHLYGPALRRAKERREIRKSIQASDDSEQGRKLAEYVEVNR